MHAETPPTACPLQVEEEHAAYERGLAAGPAIPAGKDVDLQMRVRLVDGDTVISDSQVDAGLAVCGVLHACGWLCSSCARTPLAMYYRGHATSLSSGCRPSTLQQQRLQREHRQ